jgi:hypothetical protein
MTHANRRWRIWLSLAIALPAATAAGCASTGFRQRPWGSQVAAPSPQDGTVVVRRPAYGGQTGVKPLFVGGYAGATY